MKVKLVGETANISTDIPFDDAAAMFPNGVELKDKDGKTVYVAKCGAKNNSINRNGIEAANQTANGEALLQIPIKEGTTAKDFAEKNADGILALEKNEAEIIKIIKARAAELTAVAGKITQE